MPEDIQKTEEWIDNFVEEKASVLSNLIISYKYKNKIHKQELKDFIHTLLNEAPKPKVNEKFIRDKADQIDDHQWNELGMDSLRTQIRQILTEAGVKVGE